MRWYLMIFFLMIATIVTYKLQKGHNGSYEKRQENEKKPHRDTLVRPIKDSQQLKKTYRFFGVVGIIFISILCLKAPNAYQRLRVSFIKHENVQGTLSQERINGNEIYRTARSYLLSHKELERQIGKIGGFGAPTGDMQNKEGLGQAN